MPLRPRIACLVLAAATLALPTEALAENAPCASTEVDVMGTPPLFAVVGDGTFTAGFSRQGRMVTFFHPTVGAYDLVPYFTERGGETKPRFGAPAHLGALVGVVDVGDSPGAEVQVHWLAADSSPRSCEAGATGGCDPATDYVSHEAEFPAFNWHYRVGTTNTTACFDADVQVMAINPPTATDPRKDRSDLMYAVGVKNCGTKSRHLGLAFYALFDPTRQDQNPTLPIDDYVEHNALEALSGQKIGWSTEGQAVVRYKTASKGLVWTRRVGGILGFGATEPNLAIGFASDRTNVLHVAVAAADVPVPGHRAVDLTGLGLEKGEGVWSDRYTPSAPAGEQTWAGEGYSWKNGVVIWDLGTVAPEGSERARIYVAAASSADGVSADLIDLQRNQTEDKLATATKTFWSNFSSAVTTHVKSTSVCRWCSSMAPEAWRYLSWWAMTLRLHADSNTGAIIAAPTLIPKYYGSWPRDGTYQALAWLALGQDDIAGKYYRDYLVKIPDFTGKHRWFQCYSSMDGPNAAYVGVPFPLESDAFATHDGKVLEEDQMALVLLGMWNYKAKTGQWPVNATDVSALASYIDSRIEAGEGEIETKIEVKLPPLKVDLATVATRHAGLLRPSSDAYEFPGRISGCLEHLPDLQQTPGLIASRQGSLANLAAASALYAARDLDPSYQLVQQDLLTRVESLFWARKDVSWAFGTPAVASQLKDHFCTAWDQFASRYYERQEDLCDAVGWPIQAYPLDDRKVKSHSEAVKALYQQPAANGVLFVPAVLTSDVVEEISSPVGKTAPTSWQTTQLGKVLASVDAGNDYLPENVTGTYARRNATEPLGWSEAMGILALLTRHGYRPPVLRQGLPKEVVVAFDRSDSMSQMVGERTKLALAKDAVKRLASLDALLAGGGNGQLAIPATLVPFDGQVGKASGKLVDVHAVEQAVDAIQLGAFTAMEAALERALELAGNDQAHAVILVTDGVPTSLGAPGRLDARYIAMLKQRIRERILPIAKKRKVPIHTIGVFPSSIPLPSELLLGFDIQADPGFLEDIASETGGVYVHADAIETVLGSFVEPLLSTLGFESAATWQGSVRPRESKTVAEVLIPPGTSQAHVSLVYAGSEMSVSCQGPGGPCPPMAAKARGLVHHVIQHPAPGRWTFRIHGDDVPAEGEPCRFVVSLPRAVSHDWRLTAGRHLHALVVLVAFGVVLGLRELVRRGSRQRGLVAKPGDPG